jgi:ribonuclease HII
MVRRADLTLEYHLREQGYTRIAGLDEAGRGAWAGPVVAGAVILPLDRFDLARVLEGVTDSKQVEPEARQAMVPRILDVAIAAAVGHATHTEIDHLGIVPATRLAMRRALDALAVAPDVLLSDALALPDIRLPCRAIIKGDQRSLSIAAASILAKVTRDQFMIDLDPVFPQYGFAEHKGYGTPLHQQSLAHFGPTDLHRMSFAPLQAILAKFDRDTRR